MTITKPDLVGPPAPDVEVDVASHTYAWYDPDAAAFELADPLAELDPLADEDGPLAPDRA